MTTTDDRTAPAPVTGGGRHRRNDLPPDGILAEAVRAWRTRHNARRPGATTAPATAPVSSSPAAGGSAID